MKLFGFLLSSLDLPECRRLSCPIAVDFSVQLGGLFPYMEIGSSEEVASDTQ